MASSLQLDGAARAQIYRWAYRLLRNHEDALDATQDVLLKWLRTGDQPLASPGAWLRRTTVNHCIDLLRRRKHVERPQPSPPAHGPEQVGPPEQAWRARLTAALAGLSEQQRTVLLAKVYDDASFADVATDLGLSVSTVKTHFVRAVQAMRAALGAAWENER